MRSIENFGQPQMPDKDDFFDRPFDSRQLEMIADQADKDLGSDAENIIYQEKVDENLSYIVSSERPYISFYLRDQDDKDWMYFRFNNQDGRLSLEHREVDKEAKSLGYTGSQFLKKSEDFLKRLIEMGGRGEIKGFLIDSGQVGVIDWALKNGYRFSDLKQEEMFKSIIGGQDKDHLVTDKFRSGNKYTKYIFKKENAVRARAHLNEQINEGYEREDVDLRPFTERFQLIKGMKR